jgi:putative addiction module component (TIGR02574 family)
MINLEQSLSELTSLPISDRLHVVEFLWDSIPVESPIEISPEQRQELKRRLAAHQQSPDDLLSWDEVLDGLREMN